MAEKDYEPDYPTNYPVYPKDYQKEWYPSTDDYPKAYEAGYEGSWEVTLHTAPLSGGISAVIYEKPPNYDEYEVDVTSSTSLIRADQDWGVKIHWFLEGCLVPFISGWWCINLYFEGMGSSKGYGYGKGSDYGKGDYETGGDYTEDEFDLHAECKIPLNPCLKLDEHGHANYCYDFQIPKGTIKPGHCGRPYKLVVGITYENACGCPGPMAGFVEKPMIYFYDPKQKKSYEPKK